MPIFSNRSTTFEWCVDIRTDTKNDTCLKDIGLHAQKMLIIPGSIVNIFCKEREGGREGEFNAHDYLHFTLKMNEIFI